MRPFGLSVARQKRKEKRSPFRSIASPPAAKSWCVWTLRLRRTWTWLGSQVCCRSTCNPYTPNCLYSLLRHLWNYSPRRNRGRVLLWWTFRTVLNFPTFGMCGTFGTRPPPWIEGGLAMSPSCSEAWGLGESFAASTLRSAYQLVGRASISILRSPILIVYCWLVHACHGCHWWLSRCDVMRH